MTATKLYCMLGDLEAHAYQQLAQGCCLKVEWPGVEPATFCAVSQHPNHFTTTAHSYIQQAHTQRQRQTDRHVVHR